MPVIPPGLDVAVYEVIGEPPLLAGAVNGTLAVEPLVVTVPIVGAPGTETAVTPTKLSRIPLMLNYLLPQQS